MKPEEKTVVIHQPDFMPYLGFCGAGNGPVCEWHEQKLDEPG